MKRIKHRRANAKFRLHVAILEDRTVPTANMTIQDAPGSAYPQFDFVDPNPNAGGRFGSAFLALSTGNVVVTDPNDNAGGTNAGAVYLFNGTSGALISTLTGSTAGDQIGNNGIYSLSSGNFVILSSNWDNGTVVNAGAATWGSGTTGVSGIISAANSLVGSTANDKVGSVSATALSNGNYVVRSPNWDNGAVVDAGAATWGNGATGVTGVISSANSLVGTSASDQVSLSGVSSLTNGNYVVLSPNWDNGAVVNAGAATWGSGTLGVTGAVTAINSLVGTTASNRVGISVHALNNGNYLVLSSEWDNGAAVNAGAVTWGNGTFGITGAVSAANSLVGSSTDDKVGDNFFHYNMTNGNYVVVSSNWNNGAASKAGAVTWGNGTSGVSGVVSAANSLVGTSTNDLVGVNGVQILPNGNYVVASQYWNNGAASQAGAATWGSGTTGVSGVISSANSLVGTTTNDRISNAGIKVLSNGNYVVAGPSWDNGALVDVGAVTWGSGTTGVSGAVSAAISLIGSTAFDGISSSGITVLPNGNYLVTSTSWDNGALVDVGAVTWVNGSASLSGVVSVANSLVGSTAGDKVGSSGITVLTNGNYVISSQYWDNGAVIDAGAVTWVDGTSNISGIVTVANSLVGSTANDRVGSSATALPNGNYYFRSPEWDNGALVDAGAVTWVNVATGISGVISAANSLVGSSTNDRIGDISGVSFSNMNYVVWSYQWDNGVLVDAGAATPIEAITGLTGDGKVGGPLTTANSIVGRTASMSVISRNEFNNTVIVSFTAEMNSGRVTIAPSDARLLSFDLGGSLDFNYTPVFVTRTLNGGTASVIQSNSTMAVNSPIAANNPTGNGGALTLQSGGTLAVNAPITTDDGNLTLIGTTITPSAAATLTTGTGTVTLPSGTLVLNQTLVVSGGLSLTGVSLSALLPLTTTPGTSTVVVNKSNAGPIGGTFAGLPEGASLTVGGLIYKISYVGGDGNDVTLSLPMPPPPPASPPPPSSPSPSSPPPPASPPPSFSPPPPAKSPPPATTSGSSTLTGFPQFASGLDMGGGAVRFFNADNSERFSITPFPGLTGGVRTAAADFNRDGVADLVVGTGPGGASGVKVIDGKNQAILFETAPFEAAFLGGVFVAAGDVTGDGVADLLITPDEGGGPRVRIFSGSDFKQIQDFFGIDDPNFRGGARVAVGDINGDGVADVVVAAGFGGGPRIAAFDGKALGDKRKLFGDFLAFEAGLRNGTFVAVGDTDGDGKAELIAGGGPGGGPRVSAFLATDLLSGTQTRIADFFAGDTNNRGGIRVSVKNLDGDNRADIVTGSGTGGGTTVTSYFGKNLTGGNPTADKTFDAFPGATSGVFVG